MNATRARAAAVPRAQAAIPSRRQGWFTEATPVGLVWPIGLVGLIGLVGSR